MNIIKGFVHDRKSNRSYPADLLIQSGFWIFQYKDDHGHNQQLAWNENNVKNEKDSFDSQRYYLNQADQFHFISNHGELKKIVQPKSAIARWKYKNPAYPIVSVTVGILLLGSFILWKSLPFLNDKIINSISIETEKKLGDQIAESLLKSEKVDDTLTRLLNSYYNMLGRESNYDIRITAVKSDIVNAYALPGGQIVVYTGILNKMNMYTSLAALLGHEATHVDHRHSLKSITRSLAFSAAVSLLFGGSDAISMIAANASKLSGLKYSRSLEEDADAGSIHMMNQKQIDLNGMIDLMQSLLHSDSSDIRLEILQTHPLTTNRLEHAKMASKNQPDKMEHEELKNSWNQIQSRLKN